MLHDHDYNHSHAFLSVHFQVSSRSSCCTTTSTTRTLLSVRHSRQTLIFLLCSQVTKAASSLFLSYLLSFFFKSFSYFLTSLIYSAYCNVPLLLCPLLYCLSPSPPVLFCPVLCCAVLLSHLFPLPSCTLLSCALFSPIPCPVLSYS